MNEDEINESLENMKFWKEVGAALGIQLRSFNWREEADFHPALSNQRLVILNGAVGKKILELMERASKQ
jgi:hypothetical protein